MKDELRSGKRGAQRRELSIFGILGLLFFSTCLVVAESIPEGLMGDWTLSLTNGEAAWLSVSENQGQPEVCMLVNVGSINPLKGVELRDGKLHVPLRNELVRKGGPLIYTQMAVAWPVDGGVTGYILKEFTEGRREKMYFTGKAIPPMPPAPDLSQVRFGETIQLFNGTDLIGWQLWRPEKFNGWSVENGWLVNNTPKTDFSSTGVYGNLMTEAVFDDFHLHIEFLIEAERNSGVYLRGMYEAQVVDRDSRMQGLQGVGSIFGRIPPSENAGKVGGEWQAYDITLVDRHVTVVLNGVKVIDNQPVPGPTGGAMHTDPMAPGPIYLQGDHTSVKYRNIWLKPVEN